MARPKFTRLDASGLRGSLARKLIPVVDQLRDLRTRFGLRPYRVLIVRTQWSGGKRGRGVESVLSETEVEPVPKITDLAEVQEVVTPAGLDELGQIRVSEISGSYTEDFLLGRDGGGEQALLGRDGGAEIPLDQQVYWEVQFVRADGGEATRRRFSARSAPNYASSRFQWWIELERARGDRTRDGSPR